MLPVPRKVRPPKDPQAEKLYPETDTLKLPPPVAAPRPKDQKEITYALTRAHRKTGYPRLFGPVGVKQVPPYFIDRAKDIAQELKSYHNRHEKTKHYYDSCAHYDPLDPDLLYHQGVYHGQFDEHTKTLEKVEQCLQLNPRDHRALLLKADTYFRMCDFETALLCYYQGSNLRFPYRNWFLDGYFRTTALLYDLTRGDLPLFYGGNMNIFYRLVQGQERSQHMFNHTYKHCDEMYPLEPNLNGVQSEINMFDVAKPEPPNHVQRRIWKAAIQQLRGARKCLGAFWDCKIEIEQYLIKREHFLPRFGRANQTEKIERALKYLRGRIEKFEVICALTKSRQMRMHYDKPVDWLLLYGRWMAEKQVVSSIPPATTGGLHNSRYKWALSQTLFDMREKPMDICWVRKHGRQTRSNHLMARRRSWKYICGYKSAKRGALAALRSGGQNWSFMQKLKRTVWDGLEQHAPSPEALSMPKHIREINNQIQQYQTTKEALETASTLVMPVTVNDNKDKLYYDPETDEQQWDENREMVKTALLKRGKVPSLLPLPMEHRPIPANLLEVFETKANEDATAWDQRRKMSMELRENLAKAEAVKAAHAAHEKHGLFGAAKATKKETIKVKTKKNSDLDVSDSEERNSVVAEGGPVATVPGELPAQTEPADAAVPDEVSAAQDDVDKEKTDDDKLPLRPARKSRRPVERPHYDILNKRSEREYQDKPRFKRRMLKIPEMDDRPTTVTVEERVKTPEEVEAEKLLALRADDPVEQARRTFDNQKAALLEKSYAVLMTCTKVSEFLEIELEIGDLLESTFPPKNMRFPNGDPIMIDGYPAPGNEFTRMVPSEMFANRKKRKKKYGGSEGGRAATAAEERREADAVKRLIAEKDRRQSVLAAASTANIEQPIAKAVANKTTKTVEKTITNAVAAIPTKAPSRAAEDPVAQSTVKEPASEVESVVKPDDGIKSVDLPGETSSETGTEITASQPILHKKKPESLIFHLSRPL